MRLFGKILEVDDPEVSKRLDAILGQSSSTFRELDDACPGLDRAALQAIRELENRRLPVAKLIVKEKRLQALPYPEYDDDGKPCSERGCDCGASHRSQWYPLETSRI